jgi:hypothetical protein
MPDSRERDAILSRLKEELQHHPVVTQVRFRPSAISARNLEAELDPIRFDSGERSRTATLDVRWHPKDGDDWFRIHYSDPATGFDCGWHQDDDHPELGPAHFQWRDGDEAPTRESVRFSHETPVGILWECLERLETAIEER